MDKRTLQKLKDEVDEAAVAVKEAEEVLASARQSLWDAKREIRRAQKLTPAMQTIIEQMLSGAFLRCSTHYSPGRWFIVRPDQQFNSRITIRLSVAEGLRTREMIGPGIQTGFGIVQHELTDHGRTAAEGKTDE